MYLLGEEETEKEQETWGGRRLFLTKFDRRKLRVLREVQRKVGLEDFKKLCAGVPAILASNSLASIARGRERERERREECRRARSRIKRRNNWKEEDEIQ